jgi:hypothetical protein
MSSERLAELLPRLQAATERHGRDRSSVPVYCGARPGAVALDDLRPYQDLGVHSLQVPLDTTDDLKQFADETLPYLR